MPRLMMALKRHVRQRLRHSPLIIKFGIDSICYAASCSWQLYVQVMLRSLVGLLLALALIQCFVSPLEAHLLHTSWANDSHSLLAALADPSVGRVVLTGDIFFEPEDYTLQDFVSIAAGQHIVITTEGTPNFTDPLGPVYAGSVTVNFSNLWPVITVSGGASLQIENVLLVGLRHPSSPDVAGITRVRALVAWPTINAEPGAEIVFNNTMLRPFVSDCGPSFTQQRIMQLWTSFGAYAISTIPSDPFLFIVQGTQVLELPVVSAHSNEPSFGDVRVVNYGLSLRCEHDPGLDGPVDDGGPTDDDSTAAGGGGHSPAWWVWLIVGVAGACALVAIVVAVGWWTVSRRVRAPPRLVPPPSELDPKAASEVGDKVDEGNPSQHTVPGSWVSSQSLAATEPHSHQPGISHALRIRFGDLDESVELGELIGKGGFGRVYKARWKGAAAAIKVMEHSMPSTPGASASGSSQAPATSPPLETILATALSHPNLVATYKVTSVRLRDAPSSSLSMPSVGGPTGEPSAAGEPSQVALLPGSECDPSGQPGTAALPGASKGAAPSSPAGEAQDQGTGSSEQPARTVEERTGSEAAAHSTPLPVGDEQQHRQHSVLFETWMVLEYCDKGSLADAIAKRKFRSRQTGQPAMHAILLCLQDIARGMGYLHSNNVIHGDLKPANVLFKSREDGTRGFTCKIADLGLSRLLDPQQSQRLTRSCGTVAYMPPEMLSAGRLTTACDVYSFGILMWELVTCQFAFAHLPAAQIYYKVVHLGERLGLPQGLRVPTEYLDLMQRCWAAEPEHRPPFSVISQEVAAMLAEG